MNIPPFLKFPSHMKGHGSIAEVRTQPNANPAVTYNAKVSNSQSRQAALELFERTLAMGYEKLQAKQGVVAQYTAFEPLTAEKVAGNILGFIEHRLRMDAAEGATLEQLQSRLEAGLAGFQKGFAEASEKLEALSMLSPEVEQDIGKTYELVMDGIDVLRKKFLEDLINPDAS